MPFPGQQIRSRGFHRGYNLYGKKLEFLGRNISSGVPFFSITTMMLAPGVFIGYPAFRLTNDLLVIGKISNGLVHSIPFI